MKLIVGLGNPGKEYEHTRHNVGFQVLDTYAKQIGVSFRQEKFGGLYAETLYLGEKIILLKPQKYMNLSGEVVRPFLDYFKIPIDNLYIIHDDLDIPVGTFKLKKQGSSGGHNGLKNIEQNLGTQVYKRIKIGISKDKLIDTKDYVLGKITGEEREKLDCVISTICDIIPDILTKTFDQVMNMYQHKENNNKE